MAEEAAVEEAAAEEALGGGGRSGLQRTSLAVVLSYGFTLSTVVKRRGSQPSASRLPPSLGQRRWDEGGGRAIACSRANENV